MSPSKIQCIQASITLRASILTQIYDQVIWQAHLVWQYSWQRLTALKTFCLQTATLSNSMSWLPSQNLFITSLAKEVMFLVALVCLSVCLSVNNITQKVMNGLGWNFMDGSCSSTSKNWLNFGGDLGIVRWVNEQKNTVIVVAYPDRGEGNDPEPFYFFILFFYFLGGWVVFHNQGSTFLQWTIWE